MAHPDVTVGKQKMPVPLEVTTELDEISKKVWTKKIKEKWAVKKAKDAADNPVDNKPK
jgi:hypothetical protein